MLAFTYNPKKGARPTDLVEKFLKAKITWFSSLVKRCFLAMSWKDVFKK